MGIQLKNEQEKIGRNDPCSCGSGLKFKHCHGDPGKRKVCNRVANETMVRLIMAEQVKKGLRCKHGVVTGEHCKDCEIDGNDSIIEEA